MRLVIKDGKVLETECVVEEILPVVVARMVELVRAEK